MNSCYKPATSTLRRVTGRTSPSLDFDGWCGGDGHPQRTSRTAILPDLVRWHVWCICGKRCWRSPQSLAVVLWVQRDWFKRRIYFPIEYSVDDTNRGKAILETHQVKFVLAQFVDIHGAKTKAVRLHFEDILDRCWLRAGFAVWGLGCSPTAPTSWQWAIHQRSRWCHGCLVLPTWSALGMFTGNNADYPVCLAPAD